MHADPLGERALLARELAESPEARAARRGHERWVTYQRVWAAAARAGISDDPDLARFIASRLWPDLVPAWLDLFVATVRDRASDGEHLRRPTRAEDVVGARVAALMREHGYPTGA